MSGGITTGARRPHTRRRFLGTALSAAGAAWASPLSSAAWSGAPQATGWDALPAILARIVPPAFPNRTFDITQYGATPGGTADCTRAIAQAIAACADAGGGRVVVPAGRFLTGAIHLRSGVNLSLEEGSVLAFSRDPRAYLPAVFTRYEGTELMNYSPFIYAYGQTNIAVTGRGTLDGQASREHWWPWKGGNWGNGGPAEQKDRATLLDMATRASPSPSAVLATGISSGRTSSSRTAARTSSSKG